MTLVICDKCDEVVEVTADSIESPFICTDCGLGDSIRILPAEDEEAEVEQFYDDIAPETDATSALIADLKQQLADEELSNQRLVQDKDSLCDLLTRARAYGEEYRVAYLNEVETVKEKMEEVIAEQKRGDSHLDAYCEQIEIGDKQAAEINFLEEQLKVARDYIRKTEDTVESKKEWIESLREELTNQTSAMKQLKEDLKEAYEAIEYWRQKRTFWKRDAQNLYTLLNAEKAKSLWTHIKESLFDRVPA